MFRAMELQRTLTSSICRISEVYFFALKVYTFSIKYILFKKSILPTSLVGRALSNHFVRKSILLRKGSCSGPSLDLAPCRLVVSVSGVTGAPAIIFFISTSDHNGRLFITSSRDDNAKIYTSKQNGLGGGRSGRISKADIEAPAIRAT